MCRDEAVMWLVLNHGGDLEAIPPEAWRHVAEMFKVGDGNRACEQSIEDVIAAVVHDPLTQKGR